jgi:hypothetical protein
MAAMGPQLPRTTGKMDARRGAKPTLCEANNAGRTDSAKEGQTTNGKGQKRTGRAKGAQRGTRRPIRNKGAPSTYREAKR